MTLRSSLTDRRQWSCTSRSRPTSAHSTSRAPIRPRRAETLSMPASPTSRPAICLPWTRTAIKCMTVRSRSSRRAATPPSRTPRRSRTRSNWTVRPTSSPAARRSRPGRCSLTTTMQRSCATRCSRILPSRSACRTRPAPTGWICTTTACIAALTSSVRRTPSTRRASTSPTWRRPTKTSTPVTERTLPRRPPRTSTARPISILPV